MVFNSQCSCPHLCACPLPHAQVHTCVHSHSCVYTHPHVCLGIRSHGQEPHADFPFHQLFQETQSRWAWVCYMTEQPPHQKVIIIESIMWRRPGEGTAPCLARWAVEECLLLRSREHTWPGSCQAVEPGEQMAAAVSASPSSLATGKKLQAARILWKACCTRPSCPLAF